MQNISTNIDHETAVRALESFISENDALYELEERVGKFNVFDALRVDRREIRHSNFLAWLLDPSESHGQQDLFLNSLLMDLLRNAPVSDRPFSPIDLDGETLSNVDVRREWKNIDLLIKIDDPKCLVLIENKIGSGERDGQLKRYREIARRHFPDFTEKTLCVFLTVEGDEPSEEDWMVYTYADLHRVFYRSRRLGDASIGEDVAVFLDHYLSLIGSRFMDDPAIEDLCKKIYKNHRVAVDLLLERVGSLSSGAMRIAEEVVQSQSEDWTLISSSTKRVVFLPAAWESALPPIGKRPSFDKRHWLFFRFAIADDRLIRGSRSAPTIDREMRSAVLTALCDGKKFGLSLRSQKSLEKNWIGLGRELVCRLDEEEFDEDAIRQSIKNKLSDLKSKLTGSEEVIREAVEAQHRRQS